jgi:hypothetical protein
MPRTPPIEPVNGYSSQSNAEPSTGDCLGPGPAIKAAVGALARRRGL